MKAKSSIIVIRTCCLIAFAMLSQKACSASVEWNAFTAFSWDSWHPGVWSIYFPLGGMTIGPDGDIAAGGSSYSYGNWVSYWVYASAGDALAEFEDYAALTLAADLAFSSENAIDGDNIDLHRDSDGRLYLAVMAKEGHDEPKYYYGWALIEGKTVLTSALSDVPLYVGTGQPIPEPSSALLLVLGCAALALRRRIRRPPALR